MPLYEYRCRDCGHDFEILQRLGEGAEGLTCASCGAAALDKQYSRFATASGSSATTSAAACESPECGAGSCCAGGSCSWDSFN